MKLLFDENLSRTLRAALAAEYPGSQHVQVAGLGGQSDEEVWLYAARNGLVIVSKDNDFRQLSFLRGHPPKVVWLSVGNAGTAAIAALLRRSRGRIESFAQNPEESLLALDIGSRNEARE